MLENLYVVFVAGLLILWLVCSVILQFNPPWFAFTERYDLFMLLPRWTFFAPRPGMSDYHLLYRDHMEDGSLDPWIEIPITEERKPFSFIWNPEKKSKKVLSDVVAALLQSGIKDGAALMLSLPYLILLNVVVHHGEIRAGVRRQFVLVEKLHHSETPTMQVVMISGSHPLERSRPAPGNGLDGQKAAGETDNALAPARSI